MLDSMFLKTETYFNKLETALKVNQSSYAEFELLKSKIDSFQTDDLKRLIDLYKTIDLDVDKLLSQPSLVTTVMGTECKKIVDHFKMQLLPKLDSMFITSKTKALDFKKLKLDHSFVVPGSHGVGYEATDFIPEWDLLAIGTYHERKGDLVLWDLHNKEVRCLKRDIHEVGITYVRWIPEDKLIVTCAYDKLVKVFRPSDFGRRIDLVCTLRGHSQRIRCMAYVKEYDLMVTGGDEPDLKIWNMKTCKLASHLTTHGEGLLGSYLVYLRGKGLIGASFKSGKVRLYSLLKKQPVFEFTTDSQGRYPCGLQILPKRDQIICNTKEYTVKMWSFDELKLSVKEDLTIATEGKEPNCMLFNNNQDQILMGCLTPRLEVYDFNDHKLRSVDLSGYIKEANSLVYLKGLNKISICDRVTGTVCILSD
jgi:WD40 repeat protein